MNIGQKIKRRRIELGLTQEELAMRTELSKGFISQLERNQTSPSIATLTDILEALGTNLSSFFAQLEQEKVVFHETDMFENEEKDSGRKLLFLVPNAQKNALEPILLKLAPGAGSEEQGPHEGEEFGYCLSGSVTLHLGEQKHKVKKGDAFCFKPKSAHKIVNTAKKPADILWVVTPPSF